MKNKDKIINLISQIVDLLREDEVLEIKQELPVVIDKNRFPDNVHELLDLLQSEEWPEAAPNFLICADDDNDKFERAEGIIDYISENLDDKKFLDYGCGEGHVVTKASEVAGKCVGYDITKSGSQLWENYEKYLLTTNFDKVIRFAPYDTILLYDVLDHVDDPISVLKSVRALCNENTKVYVRCHSWMSRTGGHMYKKLNKAWLQLVFNEDELAKMNLSVDGLRKYYFPIHTQKTWFNASDFVVDYHDTVNTPVEPFFRNPAILARLSVEFEGKFPEPQMQQGFNDYVLKIKQ